MHEGKVQIVLGFGIDYKPIIVFLLYRVNYRSHFKQSYKCISLQWPLQTYLFHTLKPAIHVLKSGGFSRDQLAFDPCMGKMVVKNSIY